MNVNLQKFPRPGPRNPFYLLLLLSSVFFVVTALAYGLVPLLEQKARELGQAPPPSPFRRALVNNGAKWLLYELGVMALFAALSMGLDRLRSLKKERAGKTIPSSSSSEPPA
jgi:hypothetical protein